MCRSFLNPGHSANSPTTLTTMLSNPQEKKKKRETKTNNNRQRDRQRHVVIISTVLFESTHSLRLIVMARIRSQQRESVLALDGYGRC